MGAVHSRSSRAAEFDVRELHGIAFRRALRKQDRRLERDAAALRRRRGADSGPSRRRERDERRRVNDGDDERLRRETNERETKWDTDDRRRETHPRSPRRGAAEEMRALRLECARREAQLQKDKEALEQLLRATASEVQALEEMVASGATSGKARLQLARKKVEDLEREVKEASYATTRRRTARTDELMALCNTAAQHKLNVQDRLKELELKCADLQSQIATS